MEQERMANAQLLMCMYGSKHLEQNFFCDFGAADYPVVLSCFYELQSYGDRTFKLSNTQLFAGPICPATSKEKLAGDVR